MAESQATRLRRLRRRTQEIRDAIYAMGYVCPGSLHTRTKVCGKAACRCATDENARHGPYHDWAVYADRRLTHRIVTKEQAELLAAAIKNLRELQRLTAEWSEASTDEILGLTPPG